MNRAPAGLLSLLILLGTAPAGAAGDDGLPTFLAPLRADVLSRRGQASFRHSPADSGFPADAFDGKTGTVLRTRAANPAFLEVTFPEPREVLTAEVLLAGDAPHEWSLLAGPDSDHMKVLVDRKRVDGDHWSPPERLGSGVAARVWRVVARRLDREGSVRFAEIALQARQRAVAIEMQAASTVVCPAGSLEVRARVIFDGGYRSNSALGLGIVGPDDAPFRLEPNDSSEIESVTVRYEETGSGAVRGRIRGKGFWLESPPLLLECRSEGLPDWSVGWIERTPRLEYDGPRGGVPAEGDAVIYVAHVKNYGTRDSGRAPYLWQVDGRTVGEGFLEGLERFEEGTASLRLPWDGARHDLRFVVNPSGSIPETGRGNNEVTIQTDALRLGLWVEQPVLDHFHRVQASFRDGANGWEDWVQRQLRRWNRMLAEARGPLAPGGVTERVALDLVVVAEEGALPIRGGLPTSDPDAADRTVDLQWGFPASLLDGDRYALAGERRDDNPLWFDGDLLAGLGFARYLVNLRRLDVRASEIDLSAPDGSPLAGSPWLPEVRAGEVRVSDGGRRSAGDPAGGYSPHEASALQRIAGRRPRGGNRLPPPDAGEFLSDLPRTCGIRVFAADGEPLDGVRVRLWRRTPDREGREVFGGEPFREFLTADGGFADLSLSGSDPFFEGRKEGAFDPGQGTLLLELGRGGKACFRFLEVIPFNLAYWAGEKDAHVERVSVDLPR